VLTILTFCQGTIEFDLASEESNRNLAIQRMDFGLEEFAFVVCASGFENPIGVSSAGHF
jgi:hypothetical protein